MKGLSAGDLIHAETTDGGEVVDWRLVEASRRTAVWLLRLVGDPDIHTTLRALRELGCNTVGAPQFGS